MSHEFLTIGALILYFQVVIPDLQRVPAIPVLPEGKKPRVGSAAISLVEITSHTACTEPQDHRIKLIAHSILNTVTAS
jgi:hypothetical protein